jgi:hypothetical protein
MPMANVLTLPNPIERVAYKRIGAKRRLLRRLLKRLEAERRVIAGRSYVMDWDADRFSHGR